MHKILLFSIAVFGVSKMKSPIVLSLMLFVLSVMAGFLVSEQFTTSWFLMMFSMVYTGGMMVVYLYLLTFISGKKISLKPSTESLAFFVMLVLGLSLILGPLQTLESMGPIMYEFKLGSSMVILLTNTGLETLLFITLYLIFILIITTMMVLNSKGMMKSKIEKKK